MGELTRDQVKSLKQYEAIIERGMNTFVEVGSALKSIRDEGLWKANYGTFPKYVSERWGFDKSRAYQLIEACEVRQSLSTMVDDSELPKNERQIREVAKAPKEKQAKVVQKANEKAWKEDRNPTAKDFKAAVDELQYDDVEDDDDDEIDMPPQVTAAELAVANAVVGKKIVSAIDQAKKLLREVKEVPGTEILVAREKSIMRELDSVRNAVAVTIPHSVCPKCRGAGCGQCGRMGWINAVMNRELKA